MASVPLVAAAWAWQLLRAVNGLVTLVHRLWVFCTVHADVAVRATWEAAIWVLVVVPGVAQRWLVPGALVSRCGDWWVCRLQLWWSGSPITVPRGVGQTKAMLTLLAFSLAGECQIPQSGVDLGPRGPWGGRHHLPEPAVVVQPSVPVVFHSGFHHQSHVAQQVLCPVWCGRRHDCGVDGEALHPLHDVGHLSALLLWLLAPVPFSPRGG